MTRMARTLSTLLLAALAAVVLLGGAGPGIATPGPVAAQDVPAPTPTPVTTGNIPVIAISPELCFLLTGVKDAIKALSCQTMDSSPASLLAIADFMGNGDGVIEPADFAGIDLDGNQVHQMDDYFTGTGMTPTGNLFIMAFVSDHGTVKFSTNRGVMVPPNSPAAGSPHPNVDTVADIYFCDTQSGGLAVPEDDDCDPSSSGGDGVVVARLRARYGDDIAGTGPGVVRISQQPVHGATIAFKVVGEPHTLSFTTLESTIQDGLSNIDSVTNIKTQCPLPGDAAGFLGANGTPERSIVLAVARDIDDNAVTGALINWTTDDHDKAVMATTLTPTLDLGSFGFGAPNIICGTKNTGTVKVEAVTSKDVNLGTTHLANTDPQAFLARAVTEFTVVGVPAVVALAAVPPQLACDGTATSIVTASVFDANGSPGASGQPVNFDLQLLGTASPINANTDEKSVATSTITPLSSDVAGVTVVVTSGGIQSSILISCGSGTGALPSANPAGSAAAAANARSAIHLPDTGQAAALPRDGQPSWTYALAAALALLTGVAMLRTGARAKRR